jgi:hypothetical protein
MRHAPSELWVPDQPQEADRNYCLRRRRLARTGWSLPRLAMAKGSAAIMGRRNATASGNPCVKLLPRRRTGEARCQLVNIRSHGPVTSPRQPQTGSAGCTERQTPEVEAAADHGGEADPPELTISPPPPKMSVPLDRPPRDVVLHKSTTVDCWLQGANRDHSDSSPAYLTQSARRCGGGRD